MIFWPSNVPVPTTATFGRIDEENGVDIEGSSFGGGIYIISRNVEGTTQKDDFSSVPARKICFSSNHWNIVLLFRVGTSSKEDEEEAEEAKEAKEAEEAEEEDALL